MANKETLVSGINKLDAKVKSLIQQLTAANNIGGGGSGGTGSNFLSNALGTFSSTPSVSMMGRMGMIGTAVQGGAQAIGGVFNMMPDVGATMQRASTYYNATLRASAGMSREALQRMTMTGLGEGMTAPGSDAMVSAYLTQSGMFASRNFGSTYQETLRSVSGAAKYLNMENTRAAAAFEGMTNRRGASMMLRNFGILTADPVTGKEKKPEQIMQELYSRMTAGRGRATEEQTLASIRRGALGRTLDAMNLSPDQRMLYEQFFIEKARGNDLDFSDPEAMQKLMDKAKAEGNANPDLPGQRLNTSKTRAMQDAESSYIFGIEAATPALQALTEAAGEAASALGFIKSSAALFGGDPVGQAFGSVLSGAGMAVGGLGVLSYANRMGGPGAMGATGGGLGGMFLGGGGAGGPVYNPKTGRYHDPKTGRMVKTPAGMTGGVPGVGKGGSGFNLGKSVAKGLGRGLGIGTLLTVGGAVVGDLVTGDAETGTTQSKFGNAISYGATGAGIGAMIGSVIPVIGTGVGAAIGGLIGTAYGASVGGDDTRGNASADSGAPAAFKLIHPITPPKITAYFGQKYSSLDKGKIVWPNGHKGIDYEASLGQTIYAAASGEIVPTDSGGELGNYVKIKHDNGMYTFYAHLSKKTVTQGRVQQGQPIGSAGTTGRSSGVHLHFALSTSASTANAVDPLPYLGGTASSLGMGSSDFEQTSSGAAPNSMGDSSGRVDGAAAEDTSAAPVSGATNILEITETGYKATASASGASSASGIEPWSSGSMYGTGAAESSANPTGQGGEGFSGEDKNGYLNGSKTILNRKNGRGSSSAGETTNNVTINLTIAKATDDEARRFARMLKQGLEDQTLLNNMARN